MSYIARTISSPSRVPNIPIVHNVPHTDEQRASMIMDIVGKHFKMTEEMIKSKTREREVCYSRQLVQYLIRQTTKMKLQEIADFTGVKDHTTVRNSIQAIKDLMDTDERIRVEVEFLRDKI